MSLSYPFPFWVAEQGNEVGRLLYRWPSLTWRNYISTQHLIPSYIACFCAEREHWSPNQTKHHFSCITDLWVLDELELGHKGTNQEGVQWWKIGRGQAARWKSRPSVPYGANLLNFGSFLYFWNYVCVTLHF